MSNMDHIFPKKNYWNETEMFIIHINSYFPCKKNITLLHISSINFKCIPLKSALHKIFSKFLRYVFVYVPALQAVIKSKLKLSLLD